MTSLLYQEPRDWRQVKGDPAIRGTLLDAMQGLRNVDMTIYLRTASVNIFNGMVSLTFSCDGSHHMRYDEFLAKGASFWSGVAE